MKILQSTEPDTIKLEFTRQELSLLNQATTPERLAFMDEYDLPGKDLILENRKHLCTWIRGDGRPY